jgi:hypothetical protein
MMTGCKHRKTTNTEVPPYARIQCAWCGLNGKFFYNARCNNDDSSSSSISNGSSNDEVSRTGFRNWKGHPSGFAVGYQNWAQTAVGYQNWAQTASIDPEAIICNTCLERRCPPQAMYLKEMDKQSNNKFGAIGNAVDIIAEFAYIPYARYNPTKLMELRRDPKYNDDFPPKRKQPLSEMERRKRYGDKSVSDCINYVYNWLAQYCPVCIDALSLRSLTYRCTHLQPLLQINGTRGITISFDKLSPALRAVGMKPSCKHTGLRSIM